MRALRSRPPLKPKVGWKIDLTPRLSSLPINIGELLIGFAGIVFACRRAAQASAMLSNLLLRHQRGTSQLPLPTR